MTPTMTMDKAYVDVPEFDESADELAGLASSTLTDLRGPIKLASMANFWIVVAGSQLRAIQKLPPGWDSHGAQPPDEKTIEGAYGLLIRLVEAAKLPKPHINPTPSGGVQFEWENANRYFEVDVKSPSEAHFFFQDATNGIEEEGILRYRAPLGAVIHYVQRTVNS